MELPFSNFLVLALLSVLLAGACAERLGKDAPAQTTLNARTSQELRCTPLHLIVGSGGSLGWGSGVALSPRVLVTAGHIVPEGATYLTAFIATQPEGEAVRIERVIRGSRDGWWGGDWAIIVLSEAFSDLKVVPAIMGEVAPPGSGQVLTIAGFPYADPNNPAMGRDAVVIRSRAIPRPAGVPGDPQLIFAEETLGSTKRKGLSGSPVFLQGSDDTPVLVGIYLGIADRSLMGVTFDRPLVIQRLPVEEARRAIQDLDCARPKPAPGASRTAP